MLKVKRFICGPLDNNVYIITDDATRQCAVIDPSIDSGTVLQYVTTGKLATKYVLLTHGHFDHAYSAAEFCEKLTAPLAIHDGDMEMLRLMPGTAAKWGMPGAVPAPEPTLLLEHRQQIVLGDSAIEVRHTPGHSPGQVAFVFEGNAIVGDTLFRRSIGRYDLPGSDGATLLKSIEEQLYSLPDSTVVWPGHGEETTVGEERRLNPYVGEGARFGLNM